MRGFDLNYISRVLDGTADNTIIKVYEDYANIFKVRHDAIHWHICQFRELPFGEQKISSFSWNSRVRDHKFYYLIQDQTPDSVQLQGMSVKIMELTISRMKDADIHKITKYRLLVNILKDSGYDVLLEVIVINSTFSSLDQGQLKAEHKLSDMVISDIRNVLINTDRVIHRANETQMGIEWAARFRGVILETVDFGITDEDVTSFHSSQESKCFRSNVDLMDVLKGDYTSEFTHDDQKILDKLVEEGLKIKTDLIISQDKKTAVDDLRAFHKEKANYPSDTQDFRSFMPLPYFKIFETDSATRYTWGDENQVELLKASLANCSDEFMATLGRTDGKDPVLKLSATLRFSESIHGPGRRQYILKGSEPHLREQLRWKSAWFPLDMQLSEIQRVARELSIMDPHSTIDDVRGVGLDYIKMCQSIFREININALRKERRRQFIIRPTGVKGVFVVLHTGPKLRTGENLSTIWFRVVVIREFVDTTSRLGQSWVFKGLTIDGSVAYSRWLSTDANRLDHYIRCYDKILMACCCYASYGNGSLMESLKNMNSDTIGMIIMIYMENRRSTSKMLQDVRYLVMTSLSMFSYYKDVLKKFKEPIRSPLQAFLLNRIIAYVMSPELDRCILSSEFGTLNVESGTGDMFDRKAGSHIELPRILTDGPLITFRQMLCEMYFTMLFNKNQDDPTHASFQILSKILEGEESLREVKERTNLFMGYDKSKMEDIDYLIQNPHKNQFSRDVVMLASKLQSTSMYNHANNGVAHKMASQSSYINKYLDEFATFKSSSVFENSHYNSKVYYTDEKKKKDDEDEDVKKKVSGERGQQNRRRRCLEGVVELLDKGKMRSFDLIKDYLKTPFVFQLFKKNQIGGVREILILDIQKRILVNILESFSKVICRDDDREMLTHGDKKVSLMRDLIRDLRRGDGVTKKLIMNYNFDKTRWAPSFMPIQFLYMFLPFKSLYPSLFRFIAISLINHTNKRFLLPERLIRVWMNDPHNNFQHLMDPNLQSLKERFLKTKELSYKNESNMGQGILHYTSSFYHLCVLSLRDRVYTEMCDKIRLAPGDWRDLVSSDDSYTAHGLPMDSPKLVRLRIMLFMRAQEVVERVMNVWTSGSKSSISMLIYEFNSMFGSNMSMHPTTFKFALASVHPVNTDSFFRMVKESYIASRQIVENGGSLELYTVASILNKRYCESIYHTHPGGQNDLRQFMLRPEYCPYQLGIYPIMDPAIMIMFGPECHNYRILQKRSQLNIYEEQMFRVMHTLVSANDPEVYAVSTSVDDVFVGVNRIEASLGPIERLERIKRNVGYSWSDLNEHVIKDPMLLFNPPKSVDELKVKVFLKLYKHGASEALRTTAASIYYGRVAASVSAEAFRIPFHDSDKKMTYSECVKVLLNMPTDQMDISLLYPHLEDFNAIDKLSEIELNFRPRDRLETQNMRSLQLNKLQQRITNPIIDLLNDKWRNPLPQAPNSYIRDWINLTQMIPIMKESLDQTLASFKGDREKQVRCLLLIILRLMSYSTRPMKAIIYGPSSRAFDSSYLCLKQQNSFTNATSNETHGRQMMSIIATNTDRLAFAFNYFALACITMGRCIDVNHMVHNEDIEHFFLDNSLGVASYKKILMMLIMLGRVTDVTSWSRKTKTCFHKWERRSEITEGKYSGDYLLKIQLADTVMNLDYSSKKDWYYITVNNVRDLHNIFEMLNDVSSILGIPIESVLKRTHPGVYLMTSDSVIMIHKRAGFHMNTFPLDKISLRPDNVVYSDGCLTLVDVDGSIIIRTIEGLLHSDYTPKEGEMKEEVYIHGIRLSKLAKFRPFNTHFSIDSFSPQTLCEIIQLGDEPDEKDLDVPIPHVSQITNDRLGIDFPIRGMDAEYAPSIIIEDPDIPEGATGASILGDVHSWIIPDFDDLMETSINVVHDTWFNPNLDLNLIKTMTRQVITYQPKKILEKVLNIKYLILTKLTTSLNMLNKKTIAATYSITNNRNILYSLIYTYDKQFTNRDIPSPSGCEVSIDTTLDEIYKVMKVNLNL